MRLNVSSKMIMLVSALAIVSVGVPLVVRFPNTADAQTDDLCFMVDERGERIPLDHLCDSESQIETPESSPYIEPGVDEVEPNVEIGPSVDESELERIYGIDFNEAIPLQERLAIVNQAQQDPERAIERAHSAMCEAASYTDGGSCPIRPTSIIIQDRNP